MKLTNPELAVVLGRLLLGLNFLLHGLVRLPKLAVFRAGVVKDFAAAPLPPVLVAAFGTVLPFVEGSLGALLVLGLFTRPALAGAMLVIMSLVFGSSLLEKWSLVGDQMLYGLFIFALLLHVRHNRLCLDRVTAAPAA